MANILIVDDDADLAEVMAGIVASEGHEVRLARHGADALDRVYERRPDLILLDVQMPVLDGPATIRRLRSFEPNGDAIPFVLLSALPQLETLSEVLGTPFYIRKPFTVDTLLQMVDRALAEPRMPSKDATGR